MINLKIIIQQIKQTKGTSDGITTYMFRETMDIIADRFLDLISTSLYGGKFPDS